jgi:hypothetical protein
VLLVFLPSPRPSHLFIEPVKFMVKQAARVTLVSFGRHARPMRSLTSSVWPSRTSLAQVELCVNRPIRRPSISHVTLVGNAWQACSSRSWRFFDSPIVTCLVGLPLFATLCLRHIGRRRRAEFGACCLRCTSCAGDAFSKQDALDELTGLKEARCAQQPRYCALPFQSSNKRLRRNE